MPDLRLYDVNYLNLAYFFRRFLELFSGGASVGLGADFWLWLSRIFYFSILLSLFLGLGIAYFIWRIREVRKEDKIKFASVWSSNLEDKTIRNSKWENLLKYLDSENPSDWKLAIIEADSLLDEMVKAMGYPGDSLGERLKMIEPSDFLTLQAAWEAHKIRNRIAHEASFQLSRREARKAIDLYEKVFHEFHFI